MLQHKDDFGACMENSVTERCRARCNKNTLLVTIRSRFHCLHLSYLAFSSRCSFSFGVKPSPVDQASLLLHLSNAVSGSGLMLAQKAVLWRLATRATKSHTIQGHDKCIGRILDTSLRDIQKCTAACVWNSYLLNNIDSN